MLRVVLSISWIDTEYEEFEKCKSVCRDCSLFRQQPEGKGVSILKLPPSIRRYPTFLNELRLSKLGREMIFWKGFVSRIFCRETEPFLHIFSRRTGGSFAILKTKIIIGRHHDMKKILFVCHGNILRSPEKAYYINGFHRSNGAYYTTITPFAKELWCDTFYRIKIKRAGYSLCWDILCPYLFYMAGRTPCRKVMW